MLPDPPAIDKTFDYVVPDDLGDQVRVGSVVRVTLHGRRVGGWVVADEVGRDEGQPARSLRPIAKVTGWGPPADLIELAHWAAWRWAGRPAHYLRTASSDHAVRQLPSAGAAAAPIHVVPDDLLTEAFAAGRAVLRLPPASAPYPVALAAAARGNALVLCPSADG
ncbi:MAG: primosomal protein N' family DNA-binding protein, partial [Acidimicrobiales bacterium]